MAKKSTVDYRKLKMILNYYHKFSFPMPRKGTDFKPAQKSAITRQWKKLSYLIIRHKQGRNSFIKYKNKTDKFQDVDGIRTNKGIFYKYQGAVIKRSPRSKKHTVVIKYKMMREVFVPFPDEIVYNIEGIRIFAGIIIDAVKPDYVMWSVTNYRAKTRYNPDMFDLYLQEDESDLQEVADYFSENETPYFNGLLLGMRPSSKMINENTLIKSVKRAEETVKQWAMS